MDTSNQASSNRLRFSSGTIISRRIDVVLFIVVPVLVCLTAFFEQRSATPNLFFNLNLFLIISIHGAHVLVTSLPLKIRLEKALLKKRETVACWVAVFSVNCAIWNFDQTLFFKILATAAILHGVRQMYGWLVIGCRSQGKSGLAWADKILLYNISFVPFLSNMSPLSVHPNGYYFSPQDLQIFPVTTGVARLAMGLYWLIIVGYVVNEIYQIRMRREVDASKYMLLVCAWICFSYCILYGPLELFWLPHAVVHGLSYIMFNYKHVKLNAPKSFLANPYIYLVLVLFFGIFNRHLGSINSHGLPLVRFFFVPLFWTITLSHYLLDTIIWRKKFTAGLKFSTATVNDGATRSRDELGAKPYAQRYSA